jgi:hypothetical protein
MGKTSEAVPSDRRELSLGCGDPLPDQPAVGARR